MEFYENITSHVSCVLKPEGHHIRQLDCSVPGPDMIHGIQDADEVEIVILETKIHLFLVPSYL